MELKTSIKFHLEDIDKIQPALDIIPKAGWGVYDIKTFTLKKSDGKKRY